MNYLLLYQNQLHCQVDHDMGGEETTRFLAYPSQVPLIEQCLAKGAKVQICSMNQFPDDMMKQPQPDILLDWMRVVGESVPAQLGGWRDLREDELVALQMANQASLFQHMPFFTSEFMKLIATHPLHRAGVSFAFAGNALTIPLLRLMRMIYDVNRFNDSTDEQVWASRLKSFFRLAGPQTLIAGLSKAGGPLDEHEERAMTALLSWSDQDWSKLSEDQVMASPRAFLFRESFEFKREYLKELNEIQAQRMALWRVTVRFLTFVRQLWHHRVMGTAFDPTRYFRRQDEMEEFTAFIKKVDNSLDNLSPNM